MTFDIAARADMSGVQFQMHFPDGVGAARVTAQALREYFGAGDAPEALLVSYRANFRAIHAVAQHIAVEKTPPQVTVDIDDLHAWAINGAGI